MLAKLNKEKIEKQIQLVQSECTFKPQISQHPGVQGHKDPMKTVEDLLQWKKDRDLQIMNKRTSGEFDPPATFKPDLNKMSKIIAGERHRTPDAMYERLVGLQNKRDQEVLNILDTEHKEMFKPLINKRNRSKSGDVKRKIAETDSVDFFKQDYLASPSNYRVKNSKVQQFISDRKGAYKSEKKPPLAPISNIMSSQYQGIRSRYMDGVGIDKTKLKPSADKNLKSNSPKKSLERKVSQQKRRYRQNSQGSVSKSSRKSVQFKAGSKAGISISEVRNPSFKDIKNIKSRSNSRKLIERPSSDLLEIQQLLGRSASKESSKASKKSKSK